MEVKIGNIKIGEKYPVFIVAELSANHLQNYALAVKTIKAIKKAGADGVKLQTYSPDTMTINCANRYFKISQGTPWDGMSLYELYGKAYTPWEWQPRLQKVAEKLGLVFFSTPFDKTSVDFLTRLRIPAYKIASFEICDIPLIEYTASKGKPVILSTGMADCLAIKDAVSACRRMGNTEIVLLKCTSAYPALLAFANLRMIPRLKNDFKCIVGVSDHTLGTTVPVAAVSIGARIVEKHFILNRKLGGPDAAFSLEPDEFKEMVKRIREAESAMGRITYLLSDTVKKNRVFMRSLFVVQDVEAGQRFTADNIRSIRPGYGLAPKYYHTIIGRKARKSIKRGTPLRWDFVSKK